MICVGCESASRKPPRESIPSFLLSSPASSLLPLALSPAPCPLPCPALPCAVSPSVVPRVTPGGWARFASRGGGSSRSAPTGAGHTEAREGARGGGNRTGRRRRTDGRPKGGPDRTGAPRETETGGTGGEGDGLLTAEGGAGTECRRRGGSSASLGQAGRHHRSQARRRLRPR